MNVTAFILCSIALLYSFSVMRYSLLLLFCCLGVSLGVFMLSPEYETYAGLSGIIHGIIVAGLILNKRHPYWVNGLFLFLVFAKIIQEQQPSYQTTALQSMLPVAVAFGAHLYGGISGVVFGGAALTLDKIYRAVK